MAKFGPSETNISEVQSSDYAVPFIDPVKPVVESRETQTYDDLITAMKIGTAIRDDVILGEKKEESGEISKKEAEYRRLKSSLLQNVGEQDSKQFTDTVRKLDRLERGEVDGTLTPTEANARRAQVLKDTMNYAPRIVPEVRQYLSLEGRLGGGGRGLGASGSTYERDAEKEVREALEQNITVKQLRERKNLESDANYARNQATLGFTDVQREVSTLTTHRLVEFSSNMRLLAAQNPSMISSQQLRGDIETQYNVMKNEIIRLIDKRESQTGSRYSLEQKNALFKMIEENKEAMIKITESKDALKILTEYNDKANELGEARLMKSMGMWGDMARLSGDGEFAMNGYISQLKLMDKIKGQPDQIQMLKNFSKAGGQQGLIAKITLMNLEGRQDAFAQDVWSDIQQGTYTVGRTPAHIIANRAAAEQAKIPNTENNPEVQKVQDMNIKTLTNPDNPADELKWLLREDIASNVRKSKVALDSVDNRISLQQGSTEVLNASLTEGDRDGWVFSHQGGNLLLINTKGKAGAQVWKADELLTPPSEKPLSQRETKALPPPIPFALREVINEANIIVNIRKKYGLYKEGETPEGFVESLSRSLNKGAGMEDKPDDR